MKNAFLGLLALIGLLGLLLGSLVAINVVELPTLAQPPTKAELDALNNNQSIALANCQTQKVYDDLGQQGGDEYFDVLIDEGVAQIKKSMNNPKVEVTSMQYEMVQDGYWCDASERVGFLEPGNSDAVQTAHAANEGNGFSKWDKDQATAARASASASASANASASASADTSWTAEEDAIKGAAVYYNAAATGDWATTYSLLDGQSQMAFTAAEWTTANDNLGVGSYEILSATHLYGNDFEVAVLVNGEETRYTTFSRDAGGTFYRQLAPEDIEMFTSALY